MSQVPTSISLMQLKVWIQISLSLQGLANLHSEAGVNNVHVRQVSSVKNELLKEPFSYKCWKQDSKALAKIDLCNVYRQMY